MGACARGILLARYDDDDLIGRALMVDLSPLMILNALQAGIQASWCDRTVTIHQSGSWQHCRRMTACRVVTLRTLVGS